jgi:hypothetical protein
VMMEEFVDDLVTRAFSLATLEDYEYFSKSQKWSKAEFVRSKPPHIVANERLCRFGGEPYVLGDRIPCVYMHTPGSTTTAQKAITIRQIAIILSRTEDVRVGPARVPNRRIEFEEDDVSKGYHKLTKHVLLLDVLAYLESCRNDICNLMTLLPPGPHGIVRQNPLDHVMRRVSDKMSERLGYIPLIGPAPKKTPGNNQRAMRNVVRCAPIKNFFSSAPPPPAPN